MVTFIFTLAHAICHVYYQETCVFLMFAGLVVGIIGVCRKK